MSGRISHGPQEKLDALSVMLAEYRAMPFPPGFRGRDVEGYDMVVLDAGVAGYAARVLADRLGEPARRRLTGLVEVLEKVLPAIGDEYATEYC